MVVGLNDVLSVLADSRCSTMYYRFAVRDLGQDGHPRAADLDQREGPLVVVVIRLAVVISTGDELRCASSSFTCGGLS